MRTVLFAVFAHHGRPIDRNITAAISWGRVRLRNSRTIPFQLPPRLGSCFAAGFPKHFYPNPKASNQAAVCAFFAGLVALADWLGSDRQFFPFMPALSIRLHARARGQARRAAAAIGLRLRRNEDSNVVGGRESPTTTGFAAPNPQQQLVGSFPLQERLLILEAETGSGKTEAAFWRFGRLFEAGLVDGLYFALPTRAAAVQLHRRIHKMLQTLLWSGGSGAVLAVPGYFRAGEAEGVALPHWQVHWDDDGRTSEDKLAARWAAENSKRYLAATVAVGTVDQAMLGALYVKHAHLRSAALSRSLLVIDEVHASDSYMAEVQGHLLRIQMDRGGHAMLMSATLGSRARSKWLQVAQPSYEAAVQTAYPALWCSKQVVPATTDSGSTAKPVAMALVSTMAAEPCVQLALDAARRGARVLVVRNTVKAAVETWQAVQQAGGEQVLLTVHDGPALHHSRFAPEDRRLLDQAVELALSPKLRKAGGVHRHRNADVWNRAWTLTLIFSLLISARLMFCCSALGGCIGITHFLAPLIFKSPACIVFAPEQGFAHLLKPAFENGLGAWNNNGAYEGIYRDLSMLELTRRLIEDFLFGIYPR